MNLVIVESPTKARTIGKFLGKEYEIVASMGHLLDLPKSTLGVDVANDFKPAFEVMMDKKKTISSLKNLSKKAQIIVLATDPDREGEAIAAHVKEVLLQKKTKQIFKRVVFHEITKEAIEEAFLHPRAIDEHLVDAQTARRVLDRLVGYKLSPLLWQKVRRGLSAGRVQSVALRLIAEREKEIALFKKESYFTISVVLQTQKKQEIVCDLIEINGERIETQQEYNLYDGEYKVTKTSIDSEKKSTEICDELRQKTFTIAEVIEKEIRRSPQPPYTTSTLQQDAARRLGLNGRRTMGIAQKLYEEGYITYHRTDSVAMAESAQKQIRDYVVKEFGNNYLPSSPRIFSNKQKLAQEAHEAIRPTKIGLSAKVIGQELGPLYEKMYELIWRRAIASLMADAITQSTTILVDASGEGATPYRLKANGSVLAFDGFLKVNPLALTDNKLPLVAKDEELHCAGVTNEFHQTSPPPRYNDASLIKTLEEKGIGRPSTYATIVFTIESRQYITREEGRFIPTPVGIAVNDFLVKNFSDIDDIDFTAAMEDDLDTIAQGKKQWVPVMSAFYKPFEKKLSEMKNVERVKIEVEETNEVCPTCGSLLVVRIGKFGKFLSCSKFPECDFKKNYVQETGVLCPLDGGKVIVRKTKKGRKFFGCGNYPGCTFAAWKLEDIGKTNSK